MLKKFIAALGLLACSTVSLAQSNAEGFYVGLSAGRADLDTHKYSDLTYTSYDHEVTAVKLFAGYSFNKLLSAEVSYHDFGKGNTAVDIPLTAESEVSATVLALKISPMPDALISPFFKVGASYLRNKETSSEPWSGKKNSVELYYGLGAEYALSKLTSLVFEYEDFGKVGTTNGDGNANDPTQVRPKALSLGIKFRL